MFEITKDPGCGCISLSLDPVETGEDQHFGWESSPMILSGNHHLAPVETGERQFLNSNDFNPLNISPGILPPLEPLEPNSWALQDEKFREWGWKTFLAFEKPRPV